MPTLDAPLDTLLGRPAHTTLLAHSRLSMEGSTAAQMAAIMCAVASWSRAEGDSMHCHTAATQQARRGWVGVIGRV
jgi:hypothetical protein